MVNNKGLEKDLNLSSDIKRMERKPLKSFSRKSVFGIILIVAIIVALGVSIPLIIGAIKRQAPINLPSDYAVEVFEYDGRIYLEVPEVENAVLYFFEIQYENEQPFVFQTEKTMIDATAVISKTGNYSIKSYVMGKQESTKSKPSQVTNYVYKKRLDTPTIYFDSETQKIYWNYVLNAEKYYLYYGDDKNYLTISAVENELNRGEFKPNLPLGRYSVVLVAVPNKDSYFENSLESNKIEIILTDKKQAPSSANFDIINQIITIHASNLKQIETFVILLGNKQYQFTPSSVQDVYVINLSVFEVIFETGTSVKLYVKGDGQFVLDSDVIAVTPNQ